MAGATTASPPKTFSGSAAPRTSVFTLTNGSLGAGTYTLIDGGNNTTLTSAAFTHNLPATTRQSFAITSSANAAITPFVQLAVTGNSESLVWTGAAGSAWNLNSTANWSLAGNPSTFYNLDAVSLQRHHRHRHRHPDRRAPAAGNHRRQQLHRLQLRRHRQHRRLRRPDQKRHRHPHHQHRQHLHPRHHHQWRHRLHRHCHRPWHRLRLAQQMPPSPLSRARASPSPTNSASPATPPSASLAATTRLTGPLTGTGSLAFHFPAGGLDDPARQHRCLRRQHRSDRHRRHPALQSAHRQRLGRRGHRLSTPAPATINHRATADVTIALGSLTGSAGSQAPRQRPGRPRPRHLAHRRPQHQHHLRWQHLRRQPCHPAHHRPHQDRHRHPNAQRQLQLRRRHRRHRRHPRRLRHPNQCRAISMSPAEPPSGSPAAPWRWIRSSSMPVARSSAAAPSSPTSSTTAPSTSDCGVKLILNGDVVNNGTFRVTSGTALRTQRQLHQQRPARSPNRRISPAVLRSIVNQGVILDSSLVKVASASRPMASPPPSKATPGHTYRLQRSATLIQPDWTDIGTPQAGNGATLTFNDPAPVGTAQFYRIALLP